MFYTIYKTTNKTNGKYYIGKHQTKNLDDGYVGSGKLLKRAIAKYGIDNFIKKILFVFDNEADMNAKEKELVVVSEQTYNLNEGGHGGFGFINNNNLNNTGNQGYINWERNKNSILENFKKGWYKTGYKATGAFGPAGRKEMSKRAQSTKAQKKRKETWKTKIVNGWQPWNKGIPRTSEDKEKIKKGMALSLARFNKS